MEMLKIIGLESVEYPKGRWDIFKIKLSDNLIASFERFFKDLGFSESTILDMDMDYASISGFHTFYSQDVKAYIYSEDNFLNLILDTALPKKKIDEIMERYFEFPE